jgi:hypothetical protein
VHAIGHYGIQLFPPHPRQHAQLSTIGANLKPSIPIADGASEVDDVPAGCGAHTATEFVVSDNCEPGFLERLARYRLTR